MGSANINQRSLASTKDTEIPMGAYQPHHTWANKKRHPRGQVIDAKQASYGNDNVLYAVTQLAQTVMRSAIGKMPLDRTFMERDTINANIVEAINEVASQWGLICRRYEIRDILPPPGIRESMEKQAEAERLKRALIIEAEEEVWMPCNDAGNGGSSAKHGRRNASPL